MRYGRRTATVENFYVQTSLICIAPLGTFISFLNSSVFFHIFFFFCLLIKNNDSMVLLHHCINYQNHANFNSALRHKNIFLTLCVCVWFCAEKKIPILFSVVASTLEMSRNAILAVFKHMLFVLCA